MAETNEKGSMAIKTYRGTHNCGTHYKNKHLNPRWILQQYMELLRDTPTLSTFCSNRTNKEKLDGRDI